MHNQIVHYGERHRVIEDLKEYRQVNLPGQVVWMDSKDKAVAVLEFTVPTYVDSRFREAGVWDIAFLWTKECDKDYRPQ